VNQAIAVVRTYLELRAPAQLRPSPTLDPAVRFVERDSISVAHYRDLYRAVGYRWYWHDRNEWSDDRLAEYLASPDVFVWECLDDDDTAGYFELATDDDGGVEIAYFGLVERFMGRGIGKAMLTRAAEQAWALGASRVWLHTCTLDSPRALPNYLARGFEKTHEETLTVHLPDLDGSDA
jgi:GNAT superfamily N-acetyltransferase